MSDLPARLEAAGPEWDSRVDAQIALAIGWYRDEKDEWHAVGRFFPDGKLRSTSYAVDLPPFTRSVDSALTLFEKVHDLTIRGMLDAGWIVTAICPHGTFQGKSAANAPLAICAAALRARLP